MLQRLHTTFWKAVVLGCVGFSVAACSSGSGRSMLALEDEKAEIRAILARKIGSSPQEVQQAFDTTPAQQQKTAAAVTQRVKQRYGTSADAAMQRYLQSMAEKLSLGMGTEAGAFNVVLLKNAQANAFTPGAGTLLLNEGLLQLAENEAQIAAVMAHEMAHVFLQHPQRQKQIRLASKAGSSMMDSVTPETLQGNIGRFLRLSGSATMNGMIRQQEMMADSIAVDMLVQAGYEPREMLGILRTLRQIAPQKDRLNNIVYGDHPLTIDRERAVSAKISERYATVFGSSSTPRFDKLIKPYHSKAKQRLALRN
jgi:predicted Zn-dependent protease